jgi:hypothetical protein
LWRMHGLQNAQFLWDKPLDTRPDYHGRKA